MISDPQTSIWLYWLIAALILILLELLFSGFVLLCFGFAALIAMLVSLIGGSLELQVFTFILGTVIAFVAIRPFFLRHLKPREGFVETNVYGLIGTEGQVIEEIDTHLHTGRIKIRGEEWGALGKHTEKIPVGTRVKVLGVSGNKLIVEPISY